MSVTCWFLYILFCFPHNILNNVSVDDMIITFSLDSARDDEHRLIARYAAKLAQEAGQGMVNFYNTISIYSGSIKMF